MPDARQELVTVDKTGKLRHFSLLIAMALAGLSACSKTQDAGVAQVQGQPANPADGNLAPVDQAPAQNQPVASAPQAAYSQPDQAYAPAPAATNGNYAPYAGYDTSSNQQPVYATDPPPPLPEYEQPPAPGDNYIWTPGYWSYGDQGYYWVPGAWVIAPYVDALWTPPYWGYSGGRYVWNPGYWGNYVGFYGGVNYGFGYTGRGYYGAYWNNGRVYYNRSVTNVNGGNIRNVYEYSAPVNNRSRVSYNGGRGGINARPVAAELAAARGTRMPPVSAQVQQAREASTNRAQYSSANGGRPQIAAETRPLATSYRAPAARPPAEATRPAAVRSQPDARAQLQPAARPGAPPESRVPENRLPENRAPENRTAPQQAQQQDRQRQEYRPIPSAPPAVAQNRPAPQPAARPAEVRPAPEARPAPQPVTRPEARPVPQPAARPAPEFRPAPQPAPRPVPEARPAPQPRPAPEARPVPQPAARPAPEARPAPQPAARPAPVARPAPQPAARPAPEVRPAPPARPAPAARPAPPAKPEEKK